jgi:hypothetical protein
LQQKAQFDCLTLKRKAVKAIDMHLQVEKVPHTRRLEFSGECVVQFFPTSQVDCCVLSVSEGAYILLRNNYKQIGRAHV